MNAIISGRSGRALLIDGDSLKSFEVDDPSTLTSRQQADLPYLFGEGSDLRTLEDTTIEEVELVLKSNCNFTWALDLTLISLDAELPDDIRREALDDLEELLKMKETLVQVENVLYAHPLPDDADIKGALKLCNSSALGIVQKFLLDLEECQPKVSEVCRAWESIPTNTFGSYEEREVFRSSAVSEGLFQVLAKQPDGSILFFHRVSVSSSIKKLPNYNRVLRKWYELFYTKQKGHSRVIRFRLIDSRSSEVRIEYIKREMIVRALKKTHGNKNRAARLLGVSARVLRQLLTKIERPKLTIRS